MDFEERLARIIEVAGMSLTQTGVLIEQYHKTGYSDPMLYRALESTASLAEDFRRAIDGLPIDGLEEEVDKLINDLSVTAIESGELIRTVIEDNGLPIDKDTWERIE